MLEVEYEGIKIRIVQGDITEQDTEVVVNAANKRLAPGGGVAGAIHSKAGPELWNECKKLGGCETGEAKITDGYNLKADYVIHTVGPVYRGVERDKEMLYSSYINSLKVAEDNAIKTISFPAISTGAFGYPMEKGAEDAINAVRKIIPELKNVKLIQFVLFDHATYETFKKKIKKIFTMED